MAGIVTYGGSAAVQGTGASGSLSVNLNTTAGYTIIAGVAFPDVNAGASSVIGTTAGVNSTFNLFNRDNQRVAITSNGMVSSASTFVQSSVTANIAPYPGYYELPTNFMKPNAAYAPRQVQLALKFIF